MSRIRRTKKHKEEVRGYTEFILPISIVSKKDISRLVSEFEQLDTDFVAKKIRDGHGGSAQPAVPMSPQLSAFLEENPVALDDAGARREYIKQLRILKDEVRVMNMTFAVPADPESLQQLATWLRQSIHPQIVIDSRLQPALVAGVYLRSQNHVFDFSVRNALKESRVALRQKLGAYRG